MSYVSPNPKFSSVSFPDQDNGSVANPASGNYRMINRYGKWFARNSSGLELEVGILTKPLNAILDPNLATQWATSGAGMTVATSDTSTDLPLAPIINTSIKLTPVSGTDYARYRFVMPEAMRGTTLGIEWFQLPLAGYTSGDVKVEVHTNTLSDYTGTDATILLANNIAGVSGLPDTTEKYASTFSSDASIYYEIRFVRVSGTSAINLAGLYIGPDNLSGISNATPDAAGLVSSFSPIVKSSIHAVTSADYTILDNDGFETIVVSTGASNRTVTLPLAANNQGRKIKIIKSDTGAGVVLVDGSGSDLINGSSAVLAPCTTQYTVFDVICDTTLGWIINQPSAEEFSLNADGGFSSGNISVRKYGQLIALEVSQLNFGSSAAPTMTTAIPTQFRPNQNTSNIIYYDSTAVISLLCDTSGIVSLNRRDWAGAGVAGTTLPGAFTLTWLKRG